MNRNEPKYASAMKSNADHKWYPGGRLHCNDFALAKADADISYDDNPRFQFGVMDMETREMLYTTGEAQVPASTSRKRK